MKNKEAIRDFKPPKRERVIWALPKRNAMISIVIINNLATVVQASHDLRVVSHFQGTSEWYMNQAIRLHQTDRTVNSQQSQQWELAPGWLPFAWPSPLPRPSTRDQHTRFPSFAFNPQSHYGEHVERYEITH